MDDYKRRKRDIVRLEEELSEKEAEIDRHQSVIEDAKKQWLDPLQELIGRINRSFGIFFNAIKCVGEVNLNIPENAVSNVFVFKTWLGFENNSELICF